MNEAYNKTKVVLHKWWYHPNVKKVYETRWVWYHTILVFELFLIIIIQLLILQKDLNNYKMCPWCYSQQNFENEGGAIQ